jgi:hypothetical protein
MPCLTNNKFSLLPAELSIRFPKAQQIDFGLTCKVNFNATGCLCPEYFRTVDVDSTPCYYGKKVGSGLMVDVLTVGICANVIGI